VPGAKNRLKGKEVKRMNTERMKQEVDRLEGELSKLRDERDKLYQKVEGQDGEIEQAKENYLGSTDKLKPKMEEQIRQLEAKREKDIWKLQSIEKKISEAEAALKKAKDALKEAERLQGEKLTESIRQSEERRRIEFVRSLPERLRRIADHTLAARNEVGEVLVEGTWISDGRGHLSKEAEDFLGALPDAIEKISMTKGARRQNHAPWRSPILILPFTFPDAKGFVSGAGFLEAGTIALNRHKSRIAEIKAELEK
jgi:chromosome segregation ATPase